MKSCFIKQPLSNNCTMIKEMYRYERKNHSSLYKLINRTLFCYCSSVNLINHCVLLNFLKNHIVPGQSVSICQRIERTRVFMSKANWKSLLKRCFFIIYFNTDLEHPESNILAGNWYLCDVIFYTISVVKFNRNVSAGPKK